MLRNVTNWNYSTFNRTLVAPNGKETEINVKATASHEVVCVECKAKPKGTLVDVDEVKEWVDDKLPCIEDWLKHSAPAQQRKRFEFCVSGGFTDAALDYTKEVASKRKKLSLTFLTGKEILEELRESEQASVVRIYEEQFL